MFCEYIGNIIVAEPTFICRDNMPGRLVAIIEWYMPVSVPLPG